MSYAKSKNQITLFTESAEGTVKATVRKTIDGHVEVEYISPTYTRILTVASLIAGIFIAGLIGADVSQVNEILKGL